MRGGGRASVSLDRGRGERTFGSLSPGIKQKSRSLDGSGRGESLNCIKRCRNQESESLEDSRTLALDHSSYLFVRLAVIPKGPTCARKNFTRYQKCRE